MAIRRHGRGGGFLDENTGRIIDGGTAEELIQTISKALVVGGTILGQLRGFEGGYPLAVVIGDFLVGGDEIEGDLTAFGLIGGEDFFPGGAVDDGADFPA